MEFQNSNVPYRFRPPRESRFWTPLMHWVGEHHFLRRKYRIRDVEIHGAEAVTEAVARGDAVMIAPNHADHADPYVLLHAARRHALRFRFLATREGFELSALSAFALQRSGAFSINRDGPDLSALKTAIGTLGERTHPLVIFPEGEIYHHMDWLGPMHEGFAAILLKALARIPAEREAWLVPGLLRYHYGPEVETTFSARLTRLEEKVHLPPSPDSTPLDRILRLGEAALAAKESAHLGAPSDAPLPERLDTLRRALVAQAEKRLGEKAAGDTLPEKIRFLRHIIRKRLIARDSAPSPSPEDHAALTADIDLLHLAYQLYSYPGTYLRENPTRDRLAETILKLEEDLLGQQRYTSPRRAVLRFAPPIGARALRDEAGGDRAATVRLLTRQLTTSMGNMLADAPPPTD